MKGRQLISSDQAVLATRQHTTPCSDCPWSRDSLSGWLGGASVDDWLHTAHADCKVDCHTLRGAQCAGMAIYRRNMCKRVDPPILRLERDTAVVFATPMEFRAHHERPLPKGIQESAA